METVDKIRYLRERVELDRAFAPDLTFKVASSLGELSSAFKLAHDAYVEFGYVQPSPTGFRLTKQHALPTTTTLVALAGDKVVATASIVQDNPLGLPMDACFDLSAYRRRGRVIEVSNFAVAKEYRSEQGRVSIPLCKYIYEYLTRSLRADFMVIAVNPVHVSFYEAIVVFEKMPTQAIAQYSSANGKPAVGLVLDLGSAARRWQEASVDNSEQRDLHHYFCRQKMPNFKLPENSFHVGWHSPMNPRWLELLFEVGANETARLSAEEWAIVKSTYGIQLPSNQTFPSRQEARYPVSGFAQLLSGSHLINIRNASRHGALLFTQHELTLNQTMFAEICVGVGRYCSAVVTPVRQHGKQLYGALISTKSDVWFEFLECLEERFPRISNPDFAEQRAA